MDKPLVLPAAHHRYQLCSPSASYSSLYDALQLRLELAVRCASALASDPTAAAGVVRHRVLTGLVAGSNGTPVHPEQLSEAAEFLAAQMAALHQVRLHCSRVACDGDTWCLRDCI